jgi:hypothetical protein
VLARDDALDGDAEAEEALDDGDDGAAEGEEGDDVDDDDEEDIGDEDGDEDGQLAFAAKPQPGSAGRRLHSGTIREEDENEEEDEEDEEAEGGEEASPRGGSGRSPGEDEDEEGSFGAASEFKTRLGLPDYGAAGATTGVFGGGAGSLSSRVEALRKQCLEGLGAEVFESVYAAVKQSVWDDADAGASTLGAAGGAEDDLAIVAERLGLTADEARLVEVVSELIHIEQDLL